MSISSHFLYTSKPNNKVQLQLLSILRPKLSVHLSSAVFLLTWGRIRDSRDPLAECRGLEEGEGEKRERESGRKEGKDGEKGGVRRESPLPPPVSAKKSRRMWLQLLLIRGAPIMLWPIIGAR